MKKTKLKEMVTGLDKLSRMNEKHMQIQDGAILRKDEEIKIANATCAELREILEGKEEALKRSRNIVKGLRQNSDSRSIRDMAKDMYEFFNQNKAYKKWEYLPEEEQEHWMARIVEILSGIKYGK